MRTARLALLTPALATSALLQAPDVVPDVRRDGAFGFPQAHATVLCETPELRVSAACDTEHLYVQALVFGDGDAALGETPDGRPACDWGVLNLDLDADGQPTKDVDRIYTLDPWPQAPGMHYQLVFDARSSSFLKADSKGRGDVALLDGPEEKKLRVDSFLIPLAELGVHPGDEIRLAYLGKSPVPDVTVNSIGFRSDQPYYAGNLPRKDWNVLVLEPLETPIDVQAVPEGRNSIAIEATKAMPEVGSVPPEIAADDWLGWDGSTPPSLAALRGKVVAVEFWATWCAPCVAGIPHLNETAARYGKDGLVILSLTDQSKRHIAEFQEKTPMHYVVGTGSETLAEYGVTGIPYAFVLGRDGKLVWRGAPSDEGFEKSIAAALAAK